MRKSCGGNCEACGGCGNCGGGCQALELTSAEIDMLQTLAQLAFLPVARKADDMTPVYLEEQRYSTTDYSLILACLEKKGLIDIDYHQPLAGFDYSAYRAWPCHGSMGLTARGQSVLELLDRQGIYEESQ